MDTSVNSSGQVCPFLSVKVRKSGRIADRDEILSEYHIFSSDFKESSVAQPQDFVVQ